MTVFLNGNPVLNALPAPVAPTIEGAAAATLHTVAMNNATSANFDFNTDLTGRYGMRVNLAAPLDFTGPDFIAFAMGNQHYGPGSALDTVENGGMRIFFIDGSGNYSGFNIYGSLPMYDPKGGSDGFAANYSGTNYNFCIAMTRTPDIASGVLDWSDIVAIEATAKTIANSRKDMHLCRLVRRSRPFFTGTETFRSLNNAVFAARTSSTGDPMLLKAAPLFLNGAAQLNFNIRIGLRIGNGVTATTFNEANFAVGFENLYEYSPGAASIGPWVQLDDDMTRPFEILQGPSDVLTLTDGSFSSAGGWQWELSGTGVATCTRVQFWRFNGFRAAHGAYADCVWSQGDSPVEVTAATVITGGVIRDAVASGLKILGGAGNYALLYVALNNPAADYDVELGSGGAGVYDLGGITVPSGYTLKLRNNSATNAVTVAIPVGMAYSTSTAGGSIAISTPTVYVDIEAPALIAGSRVQLYSITDSAEIYNDVLAGAGFALTLAYTENKTVRLRADHATKLPLETLGLLTTSGLTFLDVQTEDEVYLGNGVDGAAVTEFAPDGPNIEVDIDDPDGITDVQRLYAWMQWYMTTAEGVASTFFGAVIAIDSANYQIDQTKADIKLDNISAVPVRVIGGNLTRRDGSTVIATTSGSIQMDPGKAYAIETGVSGLTPDESSKLNQISLLALETTAQAAATAAGVAASESAEAVGNTLTLLSQPAPSAGVVAAAVWADPTAASFALESTALGIAAAVDALPPPPSVAGLALETTAQAILEEAAAAATDAAAILALPAPPTAAELTAEVWTDPAATGLARETTAQAAVNNAALAAALSA